jgi:hypothetical protein
MDKKRREKDRCFGLVYFFFQETSYHKSISYEKVSEEKKIILSRSKKKKSFAL